MERGGNFPPESLSNDGKAAEFEKLMRSSGPRIYTLAVRLTGNIADGQDLAQETFIQAYRSFDRFRGEADFGTWVYRICMNLCKNRVRYEKRRYFWSHFSLNGSAVDDEKVLEIAGPDAPAGETLEQEERQRLVQEALDKLEPQERVILVLREMEDRPYEEIAELLGLPLGTVKSRLARSREQLKNLLKARINL